MTKARRTFTPEQKAQTVRRHLTGEDGPARRPPDLPERAIRAELA